ncbi:MAG: hypothetical protein HKN33_16405 [Pyrinomonadaceae bacterium]|nr:hypothetical protein [Pyrinomonadaceae bacterium]
MSFNIAKAKRNAERYLTQGKIQAAIGEYSQIVEHDPKDINTQNMLGDLYVKSKNSSEAVKCYQRVADFYNAQGFAKKAIAVYNKIYRIEPDSIEVSSKLADLYRTRGSLAEARKHYESLAEHYDSKGQRVEALAMWENIAELDPHNAEIYVKIAESYWRDNREGEAAEAFVKAGERLAATNNNESAVAAFSRALEIAPMDVSAIEGLVKSQIELGYPEEAAKSLERRIESDPYDRVTNFLLVDCYYDMDDPGSAESVIVKMVERDPSNYRKFLELVQVYFNADDLDSAVRCLSMITEHMLVGGEHEELLEQLEEVLARNPEHIAALRLLARYHSWLKDEIELKSALERVVDSARHAEQEEDEIYGLSQLAILTPHDRQIIERLAELKGESAESIVEAAQNNENPAVPDFESYAPLSDDSDGDDNGFETVNRADEAGELESATETGFAFEGAGGQQIESTEETLTAEIVDESSDETSDVHESDIRVDDAGNEPLKKSADSKEQAETLVSPSAELSAADEMRLDEEIESIKFYLEQGYNGLAGKSLGELLSEFGDRPEIVELKNQLDALEGKAVSNGQPAQSQEPQPDAVETNVQESVDEQQAVVVHTEADEEAAEPIVDSELVSVEEVRVSGAPEEPQSDSQSDHTEMAEDTGYSDEFVGNESNENSSSEVNQEAKPDERDLSNSFENLREELGLEESEPVEEDDYDNHYQHAVVYQEMGMVEEAIREFQDAVNSVSPDDETHRFLNCCTLLGHCFLEKGMPNLAITWFARAFETPNLSNDELSGLSYELANAYELNGDIDKSIVEFEKIYGMDVDFRDVGERLQKLREMAPTSA